MGMGSWVALLVDTLKVWLHKYTYSYTLMTLTEVADVSSPVLSFMTGPVNS
jgi:hypothetical protein